MEYIRTDDARIQADFAMRLGSVMVQYDSCEFEPEYGSTLSICLLQSLLTICIDHIRDMARSESKKSFFSSPVTESSSLWGLNLTQIQTNTFAEPLTFKGYITHLRDALCHSSGFDLESQYPSTGFTSINPKNGRIGGYLFVSSPDVRKRRPRHHSSSKAALRYASLSGMPKDIHVGKADNQYILLKDGVPFVRVFRANLSTDCIAKLVTRLSNHLAQPLVLNWDQINVEELVHV